MRILRNTIICQNPSSFLLVLAFSLMLCQVHASWIDPDTKEDARTIKALVETDTREYKLVFSDEFEQDGRTFNDGNDPRWTALNKNDYTNDALHFYSHDNVKTTNGVMNITVERKTNLYKAFDEDKKKFYLDKKLVQSGMVQGWNKFCVTGGIVEFSAKLPGNPSTGGLWPALWMMGNLARATYVGSSDYVWPYSYSQCNPSNNGRHSQEINGCAKVTHYGLEPGRGRGAPEIDILETMQGDHTEKLPHTHVRRPYLSASYQVSPGIRDNRPQLGSLPKEGTWYSPLEYGNVTQADLNPFFYGVTLVHKPKSYTYQSDALSANMGLTHSHYKDQHKYRVEWEPPEADGSGGYIKWFVDGNLMYGVFGESLDITGSEIPSEPMYLLMNIAVSKSWGFPTCPKGCECSCFECGNPDCACGMPTGYCDNFPANMEVDYIRVYQAVNESKHILGCSPKARPTKNFIDGHQKRYTTEGQKKPLQPISRGGSSCENSDDCGGEKMGKCIEKNCQCMNGFTGPACLTHAGFYENEDRQEAVPIEFFLMYLPSSLIFTVAVLIGGFILSLLFIIYRRKKQAKYHKISNGSKEVIANGFQGNTESSYQNNSSGYALPNNDKVNTYCVIDDRLIDQ